VVVLLDGVRLNSAQTGAVDLSTIPLDLLERIEVSRGGGSVQTGSDAIGGVVNLITKRAGARPETRVSGAAGSFETWQGSFTQTGKLGEVEALLGYAGFKTSGDWEYQPLSNTGPDAGSIDRINNRSEHHSGLLRLARDLGDRYRVEFSDQLFHGDDGRPGPSLENGGERKGQSPVGHQRRTRNVAQLRLLGAGLTPLHIHAELRAFHRFDRSRFRDEFEPLNSVDSDDRNTSFGGRANFSTSIRWGFLEQRPSVGVELRRDELDAKEIGFRSRRVLGVFLQQEMAFFDGRARLVPALRYDETEGFGAEWIPRIGLTAQLLPWLELRANAERSYRAPNFDELFLNDNEGPLRGNPGLEPEDALNLDAGLRLAFAPAGPVPFVSLEAVGFFSDVDNTIVFQPISLDVVGATNIPNVRTWGVELSGRVDPARWLRISGSWTHLDTEIRRSGNPLPGRPEDEYDVRVELLPWDGRVKLVGEMLHTGEISANEGGRLILNDRTVFGASLGVELHRVLGLGERLGLAGLVASVSVSNLTDRAVRDALFVPQPGRILTFRIEARM
jgi:outer membrane receptor protein involved in Fe transport